MPDRATDEKLMSQVLGGDERSLEVLIRRHAAAVLSYLSRMQPDRARAEDAFQEVWLSVWTKRHTFDATLRFKPWLFRIAKNRAISVSRRSATRLNPGISPRLAEYAPARQDCHGIERDEAIAAAAAAIERLPRSQRQVVSLRLYAGLGYSEIAVVLAVSESTVRSNMSHALRRLRSNLASWADAPESEESRDDRFKARGQHPRSR